jgi:hypothetical protein
MVAGLFALTASCSQPINVSASDINQNGRVGGDDVSILVSQWGRCGSADLDNNGVVGSSDLEILLTDWDT